MKRKYLHLFFAVEAMVCLILAIMGSSIGGIFPTVIAFPFEQFGFGLRALSLSGTAGNIGNEHLLGTSYVFLILQFLVDNIPYIMNIFVVFAGISLLYQLTENPYSMATVSGAEKLSEICSIALVITVLANIGFNILQLIFSKILFNINSSVQIPLFSIAFVLAALLLSRFVAENKVLKDEIDSIV